MNKWLRMAFFSVIVRLVVMLAIGLNVRGRNKLPTKGPAIIVANHNSHLDSLTLMSLMPLSLLEHIRPVAAMDYFMRNKWLAWFATRIIGIIPIDRGVSNNPLAGANAALGNGDVLILFPEGSRGEPEKLAAFKRGVSLLVKRNPTVPVYPVFIHGLGKVLPKGSWIPVPFMCDIFVGDVIEGKNDPDLFMADLRQSIEALAAQGKFPAWE